ncbi:MAG: helix-turn-helix domain-containing protein [Treponematales bacterium]
MNNEPSYYAVIPASVRYDKNLPMGARLLYGEITALCRKEGYCWAGNGYFAELYDVSERTVSNWIACLSERYITIRFEYRSGSREIARRLICLTESVPKVEPEAKDRPAGNGEKGRGVEKIFNTYGKNFHEVVKKTSERILHPNNSKAAAQGANRPPPPQAGHQAAGPPEAAAAADTKTLKDFLPRLNPSLVFDPAFYSRAASFLARNGLGNEYLAWLLKQAELKKPDSLRGMFAKILFAEDLLELYRASRPKPKPPPRETPCPVCGTLHEANSGCPECGLSPGASEQEVTLAKAVRSLPPDKRGEYQRRETEICGSCGSFADWKQAKARLRALREEFHLPDG